MPNYPYVAVVLDQSLQKPLDYAVPTELQTAVQVGMRVEVPLRKETVKATIVSLKTASSIPNIKPLVKLLGSTSELSEPLWKLAHWMAAYYASPMQKVLKCFIPPSLRKEVKEQKQWLYSLAISKEKAIELIGPLRSQNPLYAQILESLLQSPKKGADLRDELNISNSPMQTLVKRKWIGKSAVASTDLEQEEFFPSKPKTLNDEQKAALGDIAQSLHSDRFSAHLIQGVTGSGKTEVYLQAMAETLSLGKSAILLVPEVALTSQTIERLKARFQDKIAIWHHKRSLGERSTAWDMLKTGKSQIVIGARSAIFCPVQNVGLIIVDEEHDSSYKQSEEMPCYHGRDVAVMRAYIENAVILLGSATPSLESRRNADIGKYKLNKLLARASSALMPKVQIIDMQRAFEINGGFTHFSPELIDALKLRLEKGEQALLFLNRRGFHRLQMCPACQHTIKCPHCDLSLTYHKNANELKCHLCSFQQLPLSKCPQCGASESMQFRGFGTEHVERSLHALLPGIRTLRMDRDTTTKKESHEELYKQFRSHKADVLIGTQMIAKGFHFPSATLVGILNPDSALNIPDFRSAEQVFQLITQVAGRSGRSELAGEVILQTFLPKHPVINLAAEQDYEAFYAKELSERKLFSYPPFCHLIKITCLGPDPIKTEEAANHLRTQIEQHLPQDTQILPVSAAGHPKIKDSYRFQFVIKTIKIKLLEQILVNLSSPLPFRIDVDPTSTFF